MDLKLTYRRLTAILSGSEREYAKIEPPEAVAFTTPVEVVVRYLLNGKEVSWEYGREHKVTMTFKIVGGILCHKIQTETEVKWEESELQVNDLIRLALKLPNEEILMMMEHQMLLTVEDTERLTGIPRLFRERGS